MIDTHLHLWQLATGWYGWNTPALGEVHADSTLEQVAPAMAESGVVGAVLVQAADTPAETEWLLDYARREPAALGVVGYLPLTDPVALDDWLLAHRGAPLVGVRQLWHDQDDPGALVVPATVDCLRLLGERGLTVDVPDAFPRLWPALRSAVAALPDTTFVLDHCGKPPFGDPVSWRAWEAGFVELAARDNVLIKLSGLFGGRGPAATPTAGELDRVVELTRRHAGAERTMIGSDWPLARGILDYATILGRLDTLLADWSVRERERALTSTARVTYGL